MEVRIDSVGRLVIPKALRDAVGLLPGSTADISVHGPGLQLVPGGQTARLVERDGRWVAVSDAKMDDEMMYALIDAGRR